MSGHLSPSQRTAVAVEFVAVFAEAAKKRQIEGGRAGAELTNSNSARVKENLPEPEKPRPQATDEAAELFGVSGRSVRDAQYVKNNDPETFEKVKAGDVAVSRAGMPVNGPRMPVGGITGVGRGIGWVEVLATYADGLCESALPAKNRAVKPINVPIW